MKLRGVRVLDLSSFLPGPYLTLALGDHGAEVIKVEAPGGDHGRQIGLTENSAEGRGETVFFKNLNRGKKSIVLDLKDASDHAAFLELVATADVIVESSRPGVAARLGIDYDTLSALNPRLIYCSISAFGQDGPLARRPAHDLALQAMAGVVATNLGSDGKSAMPAIPVSDYLAGLQGLSGVLMALYRREQTGRGDYIDISMLESMVAATLNVLGPTMAEGRQPVPAEERTTGGGAFYRIYDTADGRQIALAGQERKFIDALLGAIGRIDLAPLCIKPGTHQLPVVEALRAEFSMRTLAQAAEWLDGLDVCWGPVNSFPEALDEAQLQGRDFILRDASGRIHIGPVVRFRDEPASPDLSCAALDEHGTEIRQTSKEQH
jgi:crotonobetainyl-CoA:carnitine CoA-transferase CaiB-like acyl-CoA transferase